MPFKSKEIRLCKYCPNLAGKNIQKCGRNKGYYRTCGSDICLKQQYLDPEVNIKKQFHGELICEHCDQRFVAQSGRQKWCKDCAPDKKARRILQRYSLAPIKYLELLNANNGICCICLKRKAIVIDHDHQTNRVRGALCGHCNMALPIVEDQQILARAIKYILFSNQEQNESIPVS